MAETYEVAIWAIVTQKRETKTTYYVRRKVGGKVFTKPGFTKWKLADNFRSQLLTAAGKGEPFDTATGTPVSMLSPANTLSWYEFAVSYIDHAWPRSAATTRRTNAEALTAVTEAMLPKGKGRPHGRLLRPSLNRWAYNVGRRGDPDMPVEVRGALRWVERNALPLSSLRDDPEILQRVIDRIGSKLDGTPLAVTAANRNRIVLNAALSWAVERKLLAANPLSGVKRTSGLKRTGIRAVDRRSVPNPIQVRVLLAAVAAIQPSGRILVAFFACLYFAAMRPGEAVALTRAHLDLPAEGWGMFYLAIGEPHAGADWTDTGHERDSRRQLKHRERGEIRPVPCPPELTAILRAYIAEFGFGPDGRLFRGIHGAVLSKSVIQRVWKLAREAAFTPEVCAGGLAATPYDLRHAMITAWLNAGVPDTDVAKWVGNSPDVIWKTYANCVDRSDAINRQRMEAALGRAVGGAAGANTQRTQLAVHARIQPDTAGHSEGRGAENEGAE